MAPFGGDVLQHLTAREQRPSPPFCRIRQSSPSRPSAGTVDALGNHYAVRRDVCDRELPEMVLRYVSRYSQHTEGICVEEVFHNRRYHTGRSHNYMLSTWSTATQFYSFEWVI